MLGYVCMICYGTDDGGDETVMACACLNARRCTSSASNRKHPSKPTRTARSLHDGGLDQQRAYAVESHALMLIGWAAGDHPLDPGSASPDSGSAPLPARAARMSGESRGASSPRHRRRCCRRCRGHRGHGHHGRDRRGYLRGELGHSCRTGAVGTASARVATGSRIRDNDWGRDGYKVYH